MSSQTPSDDKVSLTRMEFWICRSQVSESFSYLPRVQTGPLYRDPWDDYLSK